MTDLQNHNAQTESCKSFWTESDIDELGKALTFCWKNSDQYGSDFELKVRINAFKAILEHSFKIEWVIQAIKIHMAQSTSMAKPAHICAILNPQKPKITQTEFIHAKEQHALNGYNPFSKYADTIREFEAQERENRCVHSPQEILKLRATPAVHPDLQKRLDDHNKEKEENEKKMLT